MPPVIRLSDGPSNDYHILLPSDRQIRFAREIASRMGRDVPKDVMVDRLALSGWIDRHHRIARTSSPSSKQVAFAERIARRKRRDVPQECFRDRMLMSKWIDHNK
ncbi:MAG: hypothetical protein AAGA78_09120 [Pseudomonadota bacterium]